MILFPMTQEQKSKVGTPIIPRSKVDPTQSARPVSRMFQDIEGRYLDIKRRLKMVFDQRLTGRQREVNGDRSWLMCNNEGAEPSLYQVNAGTYIYDMTAAQLADLLQIVQTILDDALLDGGSQNLWALDYVAAEYERGTQQALHEFVCTVDGIRQPDDAAAVAFQSSVSESDRCCSHQHVQRLEGDKRRRAGRSR